MRKKKENIRLQTLSPTDEPLPEALETEREERYEEISGETATESVGPGYDTDPEFETSIDSADGPLSHDSMNPPMRPRGLSISKKAKRHKRHKGTVAQGRHAAARSSKKM